MSQKQDFDNTLSLTAWHPEKPHNALPGLPPVIDIESKVILKQCVTARVALAELNQASQLIPNPGVLINTLPLLEAQASSEIENIVTTADDLFRHVQAQSLPDPTTREALLYREALLEGFRSLDELPLSTRTAEAVCSRIKNSEIAVRKVPGTTLANQATGDVIYTPPVGEDLLRSKLANWESFLHEATDIDPLIRMAAAHYQFEAIHPFTDGNGRAGRVLNSLFLVEQGLLTLPILYLSRYIIRNKDEYYRLLLGVTAGADGRGWEDWILYVLRGVEETAVWTTAKIAAIRGLAVETADFVQAQLPKIYSRELIDVIFEQPYCRIANVVDAGIAGRQAASRYLKALASIGVLQEESVGREKLFVHPRLLGLLTRDGNSYSAF